MSVEAEAGETLRIREGENSKESSAAESVRLASPSGLKLTRSKSGIWHLASGILFPVRDR